MKIRWIPISEAPPILPNKTVTDIVDVKLEDGSVCEGFLRKSGIGTFWLIKNVNSKNKTSFKEWVYNENVTHWKPTGWIIK